MQNFILELPENTKGRDFFVGDIHGNVHKLMAQLQKIKFNKNKDRLICAGDIVDKGPFSRNSTFLIWEPWFFAVRGNHDQFVLDRELQGDRILRHNYEHETPEEVHNRNFGEWFDKLSKTEQKATIRNLEKLPFVIIIKYKEGDVLVNHAGIPIGHENINQYLKQIKNKNRNTLELTLRDRKPYKTRDREPFKEFLFTVHGHNPVKEVAQVGNQFWIDYHSYRFNSIEFREDRYFKVLEKKYFINKLKNIK